VIIDIDRKREAIIKLVGSWMTSLKKKGRRF